MSSSQEDQNEPTQEFPDPGWTSANVGESYLAAARRYCRTQGKDLTAKLTRTNWTAGCPLIG